jgi:stearoyl-CoA desaturase (Delta-9 desaturase)
MSVVEAADVVVATPTIPGTIDLDDKSVGLQRRVVLLLTAGPFVGLIAALWLLWGRGFSYPDLGIFLGLYLFTGIGITIGFHRLFTHRSFETKAWLKGLFAVAGSMAMEGSVIAWVADHRRHHAFADKDGDPHSPHLEDGAGMKGVLKGLWHAHMGWLFDRTRTVQERWAPDLLKDRVVVKMNRLFWLWAILSFFAPAGLGFAITRSWQGALTAFLWGSLVRVFLLHHVTWSVNSICHFYGKRPFETPDYSTNNWALAFISFGESWHNNHHAFPTSAIHGVGKGQFDISARIIGGLERLGLASRVKKVTPAQLMAKLGHPGQLRLPRQSPEAAGARATTA